MRAALKDGVPFYISTNQVILSPGIKGVIATKYFLKAKDSRSGEDLSLTGASDMDEPSLAVVATSVGERDAAGRTI